MKFPPPIDSGGRNRRINGMSLIELVVALGIASLIFAAVASMSVFTARSFVALGNYNDLDRYSRHALDFMSREIRETRGVAYYQTNLLVFVDNDFQTNLIYYWNPNTDILTRNKAGVSTVLLTNCDYLHFGISQRNPSNYFNFYPATNNITGKFDVRLAKLVDVSWKCSRKIFGQKVNTESVQTAKIVIRN